MRKSIFAAFLLSATSMVQADVIGWQVNLGDNSTFSTAQLFATTVTIGDYWLDGSIIAQEAQNIGKDGSYGVTGRSTTLIGGANQTYSFFVILYDGVGGYLGHSALKSGDTLVSEGSLVTGVPYSPANYWNAVPEPTSIGLLALGMSALLLRRRRRV